MSVRVAFAIENHLGHRATMANLRSTISGRAGIDPVWIPIEARGNGFIDHVPGLRDKHALVLALSARRGLRAARAAGPVDITFLHTQRMAHLLVGWMKKTPTYLSIDGIPAFQEQYRALHGHAPANGTYARLRTAVHRRTYDAARGVVCASSIVRDAIVREFGVAPERTLVLQPGVDITRWHPPSARAPGEEMRLLFIGGDFERKGGADLLRWARETKATGWSLDIVTEQNISDVPPRVQVHSGFKPNDQRLIDLVQQADLFVLPTRADMSPWAIAEAKASGKAVLATSVGALPEMVRENVDGWLIPPSDYEALRLRLDETVTQRETVREFGVRARQDAELRFNSARNTELLLEFMGVKA